MSAVSPTLKVQLPSFSTKSDGVDCMTCFCCSKKAQKVTISEKHENNEAPDPCCGLFSLFKKLCCCCFKCDKKIKGNKTWSIHEDLDDQALYTAIKTDSRIADKRQIKQLKKELRLAQFYLALNKIEVKEDDNSTPHSAVHEETPIPCKIIKHGKEDDFKENKIRKDLKQLGLDYKSINILILRVKGKLLGEESMTSHELKKIILQELKQMDAILQKPSMASHLETAPKDSFLSKCIEKRVSDMPLKDLNELANIIEFTYDYKPKNTHNNTNSSHDEDTSDHSIHENNLIQEIEIVSDDE